METVLPGAAGFRGMTTEDGDGLLSVRSLPDLSPAERAALFDRDAGVADARETARDIVDRVRTEGDVALRAYAEEFDDVSIGNVEVTDEGRIELVSRGTDEESLTSGVPSVPGLGGIGLVGSNPDGDVPTQTNDGDDPVQVGERRTDGDAGAETGTDLVDTVWTTDPGSEPASSSDAERSGQTDSPAGSGRQGSSRTDTGRGRASTRDDGPTTGGPEQRLTGDPEPTSDGGVTREGVTEVLSGSNGQPDAYCGNCAYFEYAGDADDLDPYCRYHRESMEDLEACEQWTANTTEE